MEKTTQSESERREGQRIRDGQGHMGNNKGLKALGAAELGLGAGGAPILITFLLGFWPVTHCAAPLLPTLILLFPFSTPTPNQLANPAGYRKSLWVGGECLVASVHSGAALSPVVGWGTAEAVAGL